MMNMYTVLVNIPLIVSIFLVAKLRQLYESRITYSWKMCIHDKYKNIYKSTCYELYDNITHGKLMTEVCLHLPQIGH